jgi:hypothetical protein
MQMLLVKVTQTIILVKNMQLVPILYGFANGIFFYCVGENLI